MAAMSLLAKKKTQNKTKHEDDEGEKRLPGEAWKASILSKYNLFSFQNFRIFKSACMIYKALRGQAPPPLK